MNPQRKIVVEGDRGRWKPGVFLVVDEDRCNSHWVMFSGESAKQRAEAYAAERNRELGFNL